VIAAVNGQPIRYRPRADAPEPAARWRAGIESAESQLEEALQAGRARLTVLRDAREWLAVELGSVPGCPARVRLARSGQTNAFATERHLIVTSATLQFLRSDDELAIVLGHELAHVILGHPERLERQGVPKGMLRGFGRNADRVRATEEEADRLGLKLAWAAGYDARAAIPFWRRYYARFDGPQLFRTHPSLRQREQLIARVLAELQSGPQRPQFGKSPLPQR
jgi:predicted Zn-dependent protease